MLPAVVRSCSVFLLCSLAAAAEVERTGGPYVPTPQAVVDAMLEIAKVGPSDVVVDLGSGDGRIVLTAAQRYRARGFGVDIDPELVAQSNAEAERRGVADRVSFREQDVLKAGIEEATVLTLYLLPGMMQSLQAKILRELRPGTRIVSHDFPFGDWKPDREVSVDVPEKYGTAGQWKSTVLYWVVPARVDGPWQFSVPLLKSGTMPVTFSQKYQHLEGAATARGRPVPLTEGKIEGERVRFRLALPEGSYEFRGVVEGDRMRGDAVYGSKTIPFTAVRGRHAPD
jgi:hypothetical protein